MRSLLRISLLLALVAVLLVPPALAVVDGIGIFFDPNANNQCLGGQPYTALTLYLIALGVSEPSGISAWETGVFTNPATLPVPLSVSIPDCIAGCSPPYLNVNLGTPLPQAPTILLAQMSTFYMGGSIAFGLGTSQPTSFPENPGPGYRAGDGSRLVRLTPYICGVPAGGDPAWVAFVGDANCCAVPTEGATWGTIKGLYR